MYEYCCQIKKKIDFNVLLFLYILASEKIIGGGGNVTKKVLTYHYRTYLPLKDDCEIVKLPIFAGIVRFKIFVLLNLADLLRGP